MEQCEWLHNGTPVWVSAEHRFGTDAMLLSHFCGLRRAEKACDLGTGCGIIPLRWHDNGHRGLAVAVEIAPAGVALLQKSLETLCRQSEQTDQQPPEADIDTEQAKSSLRHKDAAAELTPAEHIRPLQADLRQFTCPEAGSFDLVSCNPPYFTGGFVSKKPGRGVARHQLQCTVTDICQTAARLLRTGGRLCICQRPAALGQCMADMVNAGIQPKRLRLVRQRSESDPWLFLLDGRYQGGTGLTVMPDLLIEAPGGGYSSELMQIYGKQEYRVNPRKQY